MHSRHPIIAPLHRLMAFAQAVKVMRVVQGTSEVVPQTFWRLVANSLNETATIEWCKVLGSWKETTHWTQVIPRKRHKDMRKALHAAVGLDAQQWRAYHASILKYRNQMVAHHDLKANVPTYPHYDHALLAAYFMYDQIYALLPEDQRGGLTSSLDRWSKTVAGNMRAIIRAAYAGSRVLGSNIPQRP
jgi:hypothetical protein